MNSASQHLKPTVLIDRNTLKGMEFNAMLGRIEQMRATGRYADIRIDYYQMAIVAEVVA